MDAGVPAQVALLTNLPTQMATLMNMPTQPVKGRQGVDKVDRYDKARRPVLLAPRHRMGH